MGLFSKNIRSKYASFIVLILLAALIFPLTIPAVFANAQLKQSPASGGRSRVLAQAQPTTVNPTWYCGGGINCIPSTSPMPNTSGPTQPVIYITPEASTTPVVVSPTTDPCLAYRTVEQRKRKPKHHKKHNKSQSGAVNNFMQYLLQLIEQLLNMLMKLIGSGNTITITPSENIIPKPTEGVSPTVFLPSTNPLPATNPCLTQFPQPTQGTQPTQVVNATPTISNGLSPTTNPSPTGPTTSGKLPGQILNLANWKLQLPTGAQGSVDEIMQPQLATAIVNPWFIPFGNGVRFRAPVTGVTTSGSNYPRSELREMTNNGSVKAAWSTSTGTHTMTIDEAITAVPVTKKHVVAGQILAGSTNMIVIRLEYPKLFIDIGGTTGATLDANYTLGKRFTVKFEVTGGKTNIYYNGASTPAYTLTKSYSAAYFKAGAYTQSNCTREASGDCNENNYGEVVIYDISVSHF